MKSTKIFDSAREIISLFKRLVETQERQTKLLEEQTVYMKAQYVFAAKQFEQFLKIEKKTVELVEPLAE